VCNVRQRHLCSRLWIRIRDTHAQRCHRHAPMCNVHACVAAGWKGADAASSYTVLQLSWWSTVPHMVLYSSSSAACDATCCTYRLPCHNSTCAHMCCCGCRLAKSRCTSGPQRSRMTTRSPAESTCQCCSVCWTPYSGGWMERACRQTSSPAAQVRGAAAPWLSVQLQCSTLQYRCWEQG
jgi:hypothetical protein